MSHNKDLGKHGEDIAAAWLQKNGYQILLRNWKFSRYEIDIVAQKENCVYAIEVKTRNSIGYGFPEQSITPSKQKNILAASTALMEEREFGAMQVNVLSITICRGTESFFLIEDICGGES